MNLEEEKFHAQRAPALTQLIHALKARGYSFVPPTPASHARILARDPSRRAVSLIDILGWSLPFQPCSIDPEIEHLLAEASALEPCGACMKSRLRAATLGEDLFLHSAYPTSDTDAVLLGPDSYRFANLIGAELGRAPCKPGAHVIDIGTGAGIGGLACARRTRSARITLTDVNPAALKLAGVNASAANVPVTLRRGEFLAGCGDAIDLAVANPPYIIDTERRAYRDGGDQLGARISIDMVAKTLSALAAEGRMLLYTGSAIVGGEDRLRPELERLARANACRLDYAELDPDVFGEELERDEYRGVDRIALVAAIFRRDRR